MPNFDKDRTKELKAFLYNSCTHDAKLESVRYECGEDCLRVETLNSISNVKTDFIFRNVEMVLAVRGNFMGSRETILSLTVEEDFSYLQRYIQNYRESIDDFLYLLFQMFSGDEWHIVSGEVTVEVTYGAQEE